MTRKQSAMLAKCIKAAFEYQRAASDMKAYFSEHQDFPKHYIEVGLVRGSIQTARSLVKSGLLEWEGSDTPGQTFVKLNPVLCESDS